MATVLAIFWIVLASIGVLVSISGIRFSLSKIRELNRIGGYHGDHPMRILSSSHLRHHLTRGCAFATWIFTGALALLTPRPDFATITLRGLLTLAVVMFVADSVTDVRLRRRLSSRYAAREYGQTTEQERT